MPNIESVIQELSEYDIFVFLENGTLKTRCDESSLNGHTIGLIKNNKEALLEYLSKAEVEDDAKTIAIFPRLKTEEVLSFSQQRLWFLDQIEKGSTQYNIPVALKLTGSLDVEALNKALTTIVGRHESLRTVFLDAGQGPLQVIQQASKFDLPIVNIADRLDGEKTQQIDIVIAEEAKKGFDLSQDLMLRAQLLKLSDDEHVLLVTMHHIASDGWSVGILIKELSQLYLAYAEGNENPLPALTIQYADYAHWQREWLQGEVLDKHLDYWQSQLSNLPVVHSLPLDKVRPQQQTFAGALVSAQLSKTSLGALNALCLQHGATLFMGLHAAFSVLLARYSGESDIVMGSPIANREQAEVADLIGFFINTLVLRSDVSGTPSFIDMLQQSKQTALGGYSHQQVPFEQLVELLQPERSLSHSPLFQIMLVLQNNEKSTLELPGLTLSPLAQTQVQAKFDLMLNAVELEGGLAFEWEFNTDLFERSTIERMAGHFVSLLDNMLASPAKNVYAIEFLNERERHQTLQEWNDTQADYPQERCIHEFFEEQVNKDPEAIALVFEEQKLSYRELNNQANQLAHYLVTEKNVRPDTLVGISLERSFEMVIAILGITKAGAAYVPLDPDYPEARLAYLLGDASLDTVVTSQDVFERTPITSAQALCLNEPEVQRRISTQSIDNLKPNSLGLNPDHLAYVIYTSGSTGRPKGVMVGHQAIVNRIHWMHEQYGASADDIFLQKTPFSFDVSVWEFFWPLMAGAQLVIAKPQGHTDPVYLNALIQDKGVTKLHFVPSMLSAMLSGLSLSECQSLQQVFCSGEALAINHVHDFYAALPNSDLHNLYGPTEAAVDVSYWACSAQESPHASVPIGRPINNIQLHVLDKQLQLLPQGVVGELHIGGVGLARGYLNRTELTAEKFIPNPFSDDAADRLYKTGDLVRWLADGNLEYVGRIDDQVKIRGFRIELGEIENTLLTHESIVETAVVVREETGDKRIVAYVVIKTDVSEDEVPIDTWRQHLNKSLPEYMLPSSFVVLDALPLTANGKLDRKALPAPDMSQRQNVYVAPITETEKILCEIWQDILNLEQVGVTDNFFRLGGHSLLLIQLLSSLQATGRHTDVRSLFSAASLGELAAELDGTPENTKIEFKAPENLIPEFSEFITSEMLSLIALEQAAIDTIVAAVPGGAKNVQDIYPLAPLQEGILFHHQMSDGAGDPYVMPVLLTAKTRRQRDDFLQALQSVVNRHDVLRSAVLWEGLPQAVQVVCRQVDLSITSLALNPNAEAMPQLLELMAPAQQFMDITQAPLLRVELADDLQSGQYFILLKLHHIVDDVSSITMIQSEVQLILEGKADLLVEPAPYRELVAHALYQAKSLNAETFFRDKLGSITEPTAPFDLMDVHGNGGEITEEKQHLPHSLSLRIRAVSRRLAVSPAALFHTVFGMVVGACSGREDVVFGTVLSGRLQGTAGVGQMLGMSINTLPCRLTFHGMGAEEMVLQAQAELLALLPYEQVSLTIAQKCSGLSAGTPLFSAMLNYRHSGAGNNISSFDTGIEFLVGQERTNYPFTVSINDLDDEFEMTAQMHAAIDPVRVVDYLRVAMQGLVEALENSPEKTVLDIGILSEKERHELLVEWNNTETAYPKDICIHDMFEEKVKNNPEAIALVFEKQQLSYRDLNRKANQLAHYLITEKHVRPGTLVGICLERSFEMVIAILGILKAGGAYVPLDPAYPEVRLVYMMEDAALNTVITNHDVLARTPIKSVQAVCLNDESIQQLISSIPGDNLAPCMSGKTSSQLAYVIYTSGSTGNPKGVMVGHQAIVNRLHWMHKEYGATARDVFLQKTPFSFDVSVWEFFWPLMAGAQLVIAKPQGHTDPAYLIELIQDNCVTKLHFVPSMLSAMLSGSSFGECPSLQQVFCSGEALPINHVNDFYTALPDAELHNLYGPTEAAVDVSYWACPPQKNGHETVPIGRPIDNVHFCVLGRQLNLVPKGVVGELHIGGVGLARGYLNRPKLTAEKFIKNPFTNDLGDRLYKTGDLVRWLPDGNLEYMGRIGDQVKIRGFRVELGEIENTLLTHESINETVVIAREDSGDKRIVAYVVASNGVSNDELFARTQTDIWLQHLSQSLPDYMLPSSFVVLDVMPLTPNGKVDRKALPAPDMSQMQELYVAPTTDSEKELCEIWKDILDLEQVGVTDNFFRLGGHSLLATKLLVSINKKFGINLKIRNIFSAGNVQDLDEVIADHILKKRELLIEEELSLDEEIVW